MDEIKIKTWIMWAVILFAVGVLADYFFWHKVLGQRKFDAQTQGEVIAPATGSAAAPGTPGTPDNSFIETPAEQPPEGPSAKNNFLESLKKCAPEVAAQTIATPEALMEYLQKSVGAKQQDISVENFHLTLADGSKRRVHVIAADSSNGTEAKEIRYFKLDAEGLPERMATKPGDTLESLLAEGAVTRHEQRSQILLKDGSSVDLEMHDKTVYEFQYNNHGKVLSCRFSACQCP